MSLRLSIPASGEDESGAALPAPPGVLPQDIAPPLPAGAEPEAAADTLWLDFYERILGR